MKKKAFFSLFVAMLLSFGMMAKSNHTISKVKYSVVKKHNAIVRKSLKEKKVACECVIIMTSCAVKGIACGSIWEMMEDALIAEEAFCSH
jgi:hypothetical protein